MIRSWATSRGASLALACALLGSSCAGGSADTVDTVEQAVESAPVEAAAPAAQTPAETAPVAAPEPTQAAPEATEAAPDPAEASPEPAAEPAATVPLPDVNVVNLLSGETDSLKNLERPGATLLWFWAPH